MRQFSGNNKEGKNYMDRTNNEAVVPDRNVSEVKNMQLCQMDSRICGKTHNILKHKTLPKGNI